MVNNVLNCIHKGTFKFGSVLSREIDVLKLKPVTWDFPAPEFKSATVPLLILILTPAAAYGYVATRRKD
jgi:hypothetical protein